MTDGHDYGHSRFAAGVIAPEVRRRELLERMKKDRIHFLRLMFSDIQGHGKNVEIPDSQFDKALRGEIMFDGSSIEGFSRIEESDMLLVPDLDTYTPLPFSSEHGREARLICDVYQADHTPFAGCPRQTLKRTIARFGEMGLRPVCGPEMEFFLFELDDDGLPTNRTHDAGGYFDLLPVDRGEECRRDVVNMLEAIGFEIEAAHHEVAPGQHEIDFKYADALVSADMVVTLRMIVKKVARDFGLHATFMPKPICGINGSGMHVHQSLFRREGDRSTNAFYDPDGPYQLSDTARWYIGGILAHARAFVALTNPLVNSFKRLVPGFEAPVNVAWSEHNRSPLARVPTRVEVRVPDPSCNPYLAFTAMLASGWDGIVNRSDPGAPVDKNIFSMSAREKRRMKIKQLPGSLGEALVQLRKDRVLQEALGEHIWAQFLEHEQAVWQEYVAQVHPWEVARYLTLH